jgi:hypothetical protein
LREIMQRICQAKTVAREAKNCAVVRFAARPQTRMQSGVAASY